MLNRTLADSKIASAATKPWPQTNSIVAERLQFVMHAVWAAASTLRHWCSIADRSDAVDRTAGHEPGDIDGLV